MGEVALTRKLLDCLSSDEDVAAVAPTSQQKFDDGTLAAAALADDGVHALLGEGHIHAAQHLALAIVGKAHILQLDVAAANTALAPGGLSLTQQGDNLLAGGGSVHGHVEGRAKSPHRQEKLHRHED